MDPINKILWGVVANAGRLSNDTKPRWAHVVDATGAGSTTAKELCRTNGFEPDQMCGGYLKDRFRPINKILPTLTPDTVFTLHGLIIHGMQAAIPFQNATPEYMRSLIRQMLPHLQKVKDIEAKGYIEKPVINDDMVARAADAFVGDPEGPSSCNWHAMRAALQEAIFPKPEEPYANTKDVPDDELREQLSACYVDWENLGKLLGIEGHADPDQVLEAVKKLKE